MSLATRAALVVSILFVVTCVALSYRALIVFESQFVGLVGDSQEALLREYANKLSSNMAASHTTLVLASKIVDAKLVDDPVAATRFLEGRTFLRSGFPEGLSLIDKNGHVIASVVGDVLALRHDLGIVELELARSTLATGQPQVSSVFSSTAAKRVPIVAISAPVFAQDGSVIGALQGSFALLGNNYAGSFADRKVGQTGYLDMTTRDRIILMHPKPERILETAARRGQNIGLDRALEQGFEGTLETVNSTGLHALATFVGVPNRDWVLASNFPMQEVREPFLRSLRDMAGGVALAASLLLSLVVIVVRRLMRPVRQLTERLADLSNGVPRPVDFQVRGEFAVMAGAFNQMVHALSVSEMARSEREQEVRELNASLERRVHDRTLALEHTNTELQQTLESNVLIRDQLVRVEKQAALGRMVAGVAHQLNTPIGNALLAATGLQKITQNFGEKARAGALRRSELIAYEADCVNATELVERSLVRAAQIVSEFKEVAVDQAMEQRQSFDLDRAISGVLPALEERIHGSRLKLYVEITCGIAMDSYPGALGQLVTILFNNALKHAFTRDTNGEMWLSCTLEGTDRVCLAFKDNGLGIASEYIERVFDPFFTTQMGLGGSGLGLSIAYNIVTGLLGGTLTVKSDLGQGATFIARFDRSAPAHVESWNG